jgi:hypothetical protein
MKRVLLFILLSVGFACGLRAQMVNNIPNYLYSGSLGVGRNVANDANVYLQIGPNGAGTKGVLLPRVADTASITGTKRNGLLIYSNQLGAFAYFDSTSVVWRKLGFTDTTVISTKANTQKVVNDTAAVLRTLVGSVNTRISGLQAASSTNDIDNANFGQTWRWNTLATDALTLSSTSTLASGTSIMLRSTSSGVNSNVGVTKYGFAGIIQNSGTSSTNIGVSGTAFNGETNYGVRGEGSTAGVYGISNVSGGFGFTSLATGGNNVGLRSATVATSGTNYGVYSTSTGTGTENNGGYFSANAGTTNYALRTGLGNVKIDTLIHTAPRFVKHNALGVLYGSDTLSASGAPISGLTAATATNTIDNANYSQTWNWNTMGNINAMVLQSTSTVSTGTNRILGVFRSGAVGASAQSISILASNSATGGSINTGVAGSVQGSTGTNYGLYGIATGTDGAKKAVYGEANGTAGTNYGVEGIANGSGATTNYGGYFTASGATTNIGVYTSAATGISSNTFSSSGTGVSAFANGANTKALNATNNSNSGDCYAVYGYAQGTTTTNYGLYGDAVSATTNYGLYVNRGISSLQGAVNLKQTSKTATYTADATDYTIFCDATSGAITIDLPSASATGATGRVYVIKKTDNSGNAVTVDPNSTQTIDGATTYVLSAQYKYVTIQSNGTNWFIIGNN